MARSGIDRKIVNTLGVNLTPEPHTMDDVNISAKMSDITADNSSEPDRGNSDSGQLQTFTAACSEMKAQMATEAEQIVAGSAKMGKHPTFTEACSTMKAEMATEAQQLLGSPPRTGKSQTFGAACFDLRAEIASEAQRMFASAEQIDRSEVEASAASKGDLVAKAERIATAPKDPDLLASQQIGQAQQALQEAKWFDEQ
jgi:hypothetical protein